eukprot:m.471561 g.471561  ORF g.471561 m.471561 type:complete len:835 (-) comp31250_c0_seq1:128-2632(-)
MVLEHLLLAATVGFVSGAGPTPTAEFSHVGRGSVEAVETLITRVLSPGGPKSSDGRAMPPLSRLFELEMVTGCPGPTPPLVRSRLCFTLGPPSSAAATTGAVAKVTGTSGVELTRGVATYLRAHCNMSFAWARTGGNQVQWPTTWPVLSGTTVTTYRNTEYSYFQNVVASSYTFAFYGWPEWEALIDWQALTGINLALAYTGQEEVYRKTFAHFGVNSSQFGNWSNGPAWLAWSRGQSMHGVGGNPGPPGGGPGLDEQWMSGQAALQRLILARMRSLGIVPILPAFQGNIPPIMTALFPTANISLQGGGRHYAAWLDATDPLFQRIADVYMQTLIADYGTDSWYEADGYFAAGRPPWMLNSALRPRGSTPTAARGYASTERGGGTPPLDPGIEANAEAHARHAYAGMTATDPKAIWMYQGWILGGQFSYIKGMSRAVPAGRLVISDMWCEFGPIWSSLDPPFSFYGVPFIWGVLHNFGGNVGMWGSVDTLNRGPFEAFANATSVAGVGIFPEGIDQNTPYYQFLYDVNWANHGPLDLATWWHRFATERYGRGDARAARAWALLAESVYGETQQVGPGGARGMYQEKARDGITSYPFGGPEVAVQPLWYNATKVKEAWALLQAVAEDAAATPDGVPSTLRYDLANTAREVLAKLGNPLITQIESATTVLAVGTHTKTLTTLVADTDELLCAVPDFTLGWWIAAARRLGASDPGRDALEWAARAQPSTWLPACPKKDWPTSNTTGSTCGAQADLADYSNKQWGGLLGPFYAKRQLCYASTVKESGLPVDFAAYQTCIDQAAWDFQHDFGGASDKICGPAPVGDAVAISAKLLKKYV